MFKAASLGTCGTSVGLEQSFTPSTSSRLEAGSVLTKSTRLPSSAKAIAVAQAAEVLPTPPLPVKKSMRVGFEISWLMMSFPRAHDLAHAQRLLAFRRTSIIVE